MPFHNAPGSWFYSLYYQLPGAFAKSPALTQKRAHNSLDIPIRKTLCILTAMGRHFSKARVVGLSSSVAVKVCTPTSILICGIAVSSLCSSSAGPCGSCFTEPDKFRPLTQVGTAERSVASAKRLPASKRLGPTYGD